MSNVEINFNGTIEEGKVEEQKKKKRKRNRKKKNNNEKNGDDEEDDEEEEKKGKEEEKKVRENKYKEFWLKELAGATYVNTRFQDNSQFRILRNWQEKEGWNQTNPPTRTIDEQFPDQKFPLGEIHAYVKQYNIKLY